MSYTPCGQCKGDPTACPFMNQNCPLSTASCSMWYVKKPKDDMKFVLKIPSDAMRPEDV